MDATKINTIVGIIGGIVGIVGIVVIIICFVQKKVITISTKSKIYVHPGTSGSFVFDYSNNNGQFTIGSEGNEFCTKWSKASNTSIHAYKDGVGIDSIALIKGPIELRDISTIEGDFSSRCRTPKVGDVIVWKNMSGKYALTKVVRIKDDTRGDKNDELECEFLILK